jgi:DNA-binding NtrC family response regulator
MARVQSVLIVDDDADHLKIYGWILQQAGLVPVPCLVKRSGIELPQDDTIELVVLDYALHCQLSPEEVARTIAAAYPAAPIVLLSDVHGLPDDVAPYVTEFVRKGEPQKLIAAVLRLLQVREQRA